MYAVFIVLQHPMHAERGIVLPFLSVCPTNSGIVSKRRDTGLLSQFFDGVIGVSLRFFERPRCHNTNSNGKPIAIRLGWIKYCKSFVGIKFSFQWRKEIKIKVVYDL